MDMFMDKLAQKLTAQEIIKANTAAETKELNQLRDQVKDYNECLAQLQKIIDESAEKLSGMQAVNESEINRLVEECVQAAVTEKLEMIIKVLENQAGAVDKAIAAQTLTVDRAISAQTLAIGKAVSAQIGGIEEKLSAQAGAADEKLSAQTETLSGKLSGQMEAIDRKVSGQLGAADKALAERLDKLEEKLSGGPDGQLSERLGEVEENVHKECVKVYRNVQAVVVEEGEKQSGKLEEAVTEGKALGGRLKTVFGISVAALALSAAGLIVQIINLLNGLNVKLF